MTDCGGTPDCPTADEPRQRIMRSRRRPRLRQVGSDPDYRYSLANERTFLAWIRTSLALLAGGVAVVQFAPDLGPRGMRLTVGILLIVISGFLSSAAHRRWDRAERAMRLSQALPPNRLSTLLSYGVAIVTVVILVAMVIS